MINLFAVFLLTCSGQCGETIDTAKQQESAIASTEEEEPIVKKNKRDDGCLCDTECYILEERDGPHCGCSQNCGCREFF